MFYPVAGFLISVWHVRLLLPLPLTCDSRDSILLPSVLTAPKILPSHWSVSSSLTNRSNTYLVYKTIVPQHRTSVLLPKRPRDRCGRGWKECKDQRMGNSVLKYYSVDLTGLLQTCIKQATITFIMNGRSPILTRGAYRQLVSARGAASHSLVVQWDKLSVFK